MHQYVVSYDISADKARNRVAKHLLRYGHRVQYSVFEIAILQPQQMDILRSVIEKELEPDDKVRYYRLCQPCRKSSRDKNDTAIVTFPALIMI